MAVRRVSKWFRDSLRRGRAGMDERGFAPFDAKETAWRKSQTRYLHDAVVELRRHFKGFEARDGYSLKSGALARLPLGRYEKIRRLALELRRELASPHKVVRPRSAKSKSVLYKHTRALMVKGRKSFIVHVPRPETTRVKVVGKKKKRVSETRFVRGGRVETDYFYFADYARRAPRTIEEILRLTEKMLKDMPRGHYVMLSSQHGYIGAGMDKRLLLRAIEVDWLGYDAAPDPYSGVRDSRGLAETLIGFTRVASTADGARREYQERQSLRDRMKAAQRKGESRAIARRKRQRGR